MSYGKLVLDGTLETEILSMRMREGLIQFTAQAHMPKKEDVPESNELVPVAVYGEDGTLIAAWKGRADFSGWQPGLGITVFQNFDAIVTAKE